MLMHLSFRAKKGEKKEKRVMTLMGVEGADIDQDGKGAFG